MKSSSSISSSSLKFSCISSALIIFILCSVITVSVVGFHHQSFRIYPTKNYLAGKKKSRGAILASSTSASPASNQDISVPPAKQLKSILLQNPNQIQDETKAKIESLIQRLINEKVQFDPNTCLNGPLFTVLYQSGPVPFWEKYDLKFLPFRNLKGQQYSSIGVSTSEKQQQKLMDKKYQAFDLINYAEFWSTNLSIQGCGVCSFLQENSNYDNNNNNKQQEEEEEKGENIINNFFSSLFIPQSSLKSGRKQEQYMLLKCPVDYKVEILNASITLLNLKFELNVNGIGYTRILYADEEMRILLAPKDTTDERWMEKAGLVVVQVRSDLVVGKELYIA